MTFEQKPLPFGEREGAEKPEGRFKKVLKQVAKGRKKLKNKFSNQQPLPFGQKKEVEKTVEVANAVPDQIPNDGVFSFYEPRSEYEKEIQNEARKAISQILEVDALKEVGFKSAVVFRDDIEEALGRWGYSPHYNSNAQQIQIGMKPSDTNDGSHDSGR